MKKIKYNVLSNIKLEMEPLTESPEGLLLGGFVGLAGTYGLGTTNDKCSTVLDNNACSNNKCTTSGKNYVCNNQGCSNNSYTNIDCTGSSDINNGCTETTAPGTKTNTENPDGIIVPRFIL